MKKGRTASSDMIEEHNHMLLWRWYMFGTFAMFSIVRVDYKIRTGQI
jgi:hypothetical protein